MGDPVGKTMDTLGGASDTVMGPVQKIGDAVIQPIGDSPLVQKGFPILVMTILGQGAAGAAGGAAAEGGGAYGAETAGGGEVGSGYAASAPGPATAAGGAATGATGLSTDPNLMLASTNPNPGIISDAAPVTASGPVADASTATAGGGEVGSGYPASAPGAPASAAGGLINGVMDWAKANPALTLGAAQLGAGAMSGVGAYSAQKMKGEQALAQQREATAQAAALAEWKRRFVQGGAYFPGTIPMSPNGTALRRPDGTPVYAPGGGIIAGAINGGGNG